MKKTIFALLFLFFQSGCMATLEHRHASASLCEIVESNGWLHGRERLIGERWYLFTVRDNVGGEDRNSRPIKGVHWIVITSSTQGGAVGAPSIIYDAAEAEIEVSGKKVKALPRIWRSELGEKNSTPPEVSVPTNLNVMGKIISPSFLIAFPIEIKDPKAEYFFRPGTILLDGVRYPLPVYKSCYTPSKWWWSPIN